MISALKGERRPRDRIRPETSNNDHNVRGYDGLIKKLDGTVVQAGFEDDDFNVYPSHNETIYPGGGDQFNVRYLEHFPQDFVILSEHGSPWAHENAMREAPRVRAEGGEAQMRARHLVLSRGCRRCGPGRNGRGLHATKK